MKFIQLTMQCDGGFLDIKPSEISAIERDARYSITYVYLSGVGKDGHFTVTEMPDEIKALIEAAENPQPVNQSAEGAQQ